MAPAWNLCARAGAGPHAIRSSAYIVGHAVRSCVQATIVEMTAGLHRRRVTVQLLDADGSRRARPPSGRGTEWTCRDFLGTGASACADGDD
jgi:hypothetical protein